MKTTGVVRASLIAAIVRWIVGAILTTLAVLIVVYQDTFRAIESIVEAQILRSFAGMSAIAQPFYATVWTGYTNDPISGLVITTVCSAFYLVAGLLLLTAALLVSARRQSGRILFAGLLAVCCIFLANFIRLTVIVLSTHKWAQKGFEISHEYVGTAISVVGLFIAASVFLFILLKAKKRIHVPR